MKFKILLINIIIISMNLTAKEEQGESFNILVYNTHGLPEIFISDNPKMRFPVIGNKTKHYSDVLYCKKTMHTMKSCHPDVAQSSKAI